MHPSRPALAFAAVAASLVLSSALQAQQNGGESPSAPSTQPANDAAPRAKTARESLVTGNPVVPPKEPDAIEKIKHPVDWFSWGADLRLRQEFLQNPFLMTSDPPGHDWNFGRYRARLWDSIAPSEHFDINTRLTWESRYYWDPESRGGWDPQQIFVDNLNVRLRFGQQVPTTLTLGRQDIMLGDGWLVMEASPLDGSRVLYFDAARAAFDFQDDKTRLDLMYLHSSADPDEGLADVDVSSKDLRAQTEQDENGAVLYLTNKSLPDTSIEPYFIYKHDDRFLANGDDGDIYTFGTRAVHDFSRHWRARVEGAYQFGERNNPVVFPNSNGNLSAYGGTSRLTYLFRDEWNSELFVGFEYLSGDDPHTRTNEQFDPLWGRWPQWSEYYLYTTARDARLAEISNLQRLSAGAQTSPIKQLTLYAAYNALFSVQNPLEGQPGFGSGDFRGHLFTSSLTYQLNRFTRLGLVGEYFIPGDYYSQPTSSGPLRTRQDPGMYGRAEAIFSF